MKKTVLIIIACAALLSSCLDTGQTPDSQIPRAAAAFMQRSSTGENIFVTDDSIKMYPDVPVSASDSLLGRRYFVEFFLQNKGDDYFDINVRSVQEMKIDSILTQKPSSHNNEVELKTMWVSGNYLNMVLNVDTDPQPKHTAILYNSGSPEEPELVFLYDNNTTQPISSRRIALSYDISEYRENMAADSLRTSVTLNIKNTGNVTLDLIIRK